MPDTIADSIPLIYSTPAEIVDRLTTEHCFNSDGKLMVYPAWFGRYDILACIKAGLLTSKTYGPATFAHTDLFKVKL